MMQKKILIVEDEAAIAMLLEMVLSSAGYDVCGKVMSGLEAIEAARTLRPNMIMMDIKIKGDMDGIDAAGKITSLMDVPIIFLSAYTDKKTKDKADAIKHYGFFKKPFKSSVMLKAIEDTFLAFSEK
jgi:CheY-like chemotaxis protein